MIKPIIICLIVVVLGLCDANNVEPQYVKLSYLGEGQDMVVSWFSFGLLLNPLVSFVEMDGGSSVTVKGTYHVLNEFLWNGFTYRAHLTNLKPLTTYYYVCGNETYSSGTYNFTTGAATVHPFTIAAYGDMGAGGDDLLTIGYINQRIENISFCLHAGDIAYADLHTTDNMVFGNQTVWNQFMENLIPLTSRVPYMVTPGNHDVFIDTAVYRKTFAMPTTSDPFSTWYSFDYNGVHFVSVSSEHPYMPLTIQHEWLQKDLSNFRKTNPTGFIVAFAHRPFYCSTIYIWCRDDPFKIMFVDSVESIFYKYNVDLFIAGHTHSYERTLPTYESNVMGTYDNPKATVHLVVGTGGCQESIQHEWQPQPSWSSGARILKAGYGTLSLINSTTIEWNFYADNDLMDSVYITKGYFN